MWVDFFRRSELLSVPWQVPEREQYQGGRRRLLRVRGQGEPGALQDHLEAQRE